jgi:molybdenum cofactor cytidylyltransferase
MRTFGLIPAAGQSRRMGRPKLLLPCGAGTVLEQVVAAVRAAGVADVLVVVGPHGDELQAVAERAGARALRLSDETADMRATCVQGLCWLEEQLRPAPTDGWLLLPADHPTVRPAVVRSLLEAAAGTSHASIVVPIHDGRRGHPVWLRWSHVAAIRALPDGQGLNTYIRARAGETLELPWPDDEILRDLDTPEDYRRLLAESGYEPPTG